MLITENTSFSVEVITQAFDQDYVIYMQTELCGI